MTQKPFPARNSINGCLRGIEGSPSHKIITFWALRCREAGRNSATICCLNLVLNMCPALSLMRGRSPLPPEKALWGRRRLWKHWGKGWSPRNNPINSGLSFHATGCSKRGYSFRARLPCTCSQALVLTLVAYLAYHRDSLLVVRLQDSIVLAGNLSRAAPTKLDESSTEGQTPRRSHSFVLSGHPTNSVSRDWTRFKR